MLKDVIYMTDCKTPEDVVASRSFISRLQEVLKKYYEQQKIGNRYQVNGVAYKVDQGKSINFTEYGVLKSVLFDPNFAKVAKEFFDARISATKEQFQAIDIDSLRVAFFQKMISSLSKYLVESPQISKSDGQKMLSYGKLEVYSLGGEYLVKDSKEQVHHVGYSDPSSLQYGYAIFYSGEKLKVFDTTSGNEIPQKLSRHARILFQAYEKSGCIIANELSSNTILDGQFQILYTSKNTLQYSQDFGVFLEFEGNIPKKALYLQDGEILVFEVMKDAQKSNDEQTVYGVIKDGQMSTVFVNKHDKPNRIVG